MRPTPPTEEATTVAAVCAAFGVAAPVTVTRVSEGYLNRDEAVTLADGRHLFLKGSRHRDPRLVEAEHAVIRHAVAQGIPTPLPLLTPAGRSVVVLNETPWSAFPFVTGTTLTGLNLPETLGTLLARVHQALRNCPTAGLTFAETALSWDTAATRTTMAAIATHIAARQVAGRADAFDHFTLEAFRALHAILADAPPPAAFATLPCQVIHGDCYPPNVLCDPDGVPLALLDWEFATVRPRVWDVARMLAFTFLGVHGEPADFAAAQRCIAAYQAIAPLPNEEIVAGISLYHWRTAHNVIKYRWHDDRGPQPTDALVPGELLLTQWLHQHAETFAHYLVGQAPPPPPISPR